MLHSVLIATLNHLLQGADWARNRLRPFIGRAVRFDVPPLQVALQLDVDGYFIAHEGELTDVVIRLPADTPVLLMHGLDRVMASAHVEGNAEFATELSFVLRHLRWDAEEDISRVLGDILAHRLIQGFHQLASWQRQAAANLQGNIAEYLVHENPIVVSRTEFARFHDEIGSLTGDLDRIEARLRAV